jgi:hypothetical protein
MLFLIAVYIVKFSTALVGKTRTPQMVKKIPIFSETRMVITAAKRKRREGKERRNRNKDSARKLS